MPLLTDLEKQGGRWFREWSQMQLELSHESSPPTFAPPPWLRYFRHNCEKRGGRSTALDLKEIYEWSPRMWVCYCSVVGPIADDFPHRDCDGGKELSVAGRFGFIYKEGRCSCGATARSKAGRLVDAYERPPVTGRVARA